ncbi:helix-turn-helix domain-containing protein [Nonomuraea glycinis]|uniref:helix-turn-helix domain-containing protein n=1 Tax=Nonomuraea glycinis TaxID=2047744 RepID=UPI002E161B66|nr:helix-turn-helix domain-containing protein [Nonomuraea glycinis]
MPAEPGLPPEVAFGHKLRELRHSQKWSLEALGTRVGYSGTMVGYFERAKRPVPESFVAMAEAALGLDGELAALWKEINPKAAPKWFRAWPKIETAARVIRSWEPLLVPGLLQTSDYARAVLRGIPGATDEEVEELVSARLQRQRIFDRASPPMYAAVLDEGILHRPIGGRQVMREQLGHLATLMDHPKIAIQIVPFEAGATTGLLGGFAIAQLPEAKDWAYLESASSGQVTDRVDEIRTLNVIYDTIRAWAHPLHVTKDVIRDMTARYEP